MSGLGLHEFSSIGQKKSTFTSAPQSSLFFRKISSFFQYFSPFLQQQCSNNCNQLIKTFG